MIKINTNHDLKKIHKEAISKKIKFEIKKILKKGVIKNRAGKILFKIKIKEKRLLNFILSHTHLFTIANTHQQILLIKHFRNNYPELVKKYSKVKRQPNIYKLAYYLFITRGYDEFSKGFKYLSKNIDKNYDAYHFVKELNLKCCPYCNRNYISLIDKTDDIDKKRRPQIDHFHPKMKYPFLAVNFYNLIPSCGTCNLLKHSDESIRLINPYSLKNNDLQNFTFNINNLKFYTHYKKLDFENEDSIEIKLINFPKRNNHLFQIEKLYQEHNDYALDIIIKHIHYPKSYISTLAEKGFSEESVHRFIYSNYLKDDNLKKRPLSKLTRDIVNELNQLEKNYLKKLKD